MCFTSFSIALTLREFELGLNAVFPFSALTLFPIRGVMIPVALSRVRRCIPLLVTMERQLPQSVVNRNPLRHYSKGKDKGGRKGAKPKMELRDDEIAEVMNFRSFRDQLEKQVQNLAHTYQKQLTITNPTGGVETLEIQFDNATVTICEVAQIQKKKNLVVLQFAAFPEAIKPAVKAIEASGMPLSVQQEGTSVYLHLAKMSRQQREEMAKNAKELFHKCKDALLKLERKSAKEIQAQKQVHSTDLCFGAAQMVKFEVEQTIAKAEEIMKAKQKELLAD